MLKNTFENGCQVTSWPMLDTMSGWATTAETRTQETTAHWIPRKIRSGSSGPSVDIPTNVHTFSHVFYTG
jgi:hypothetical protein